MTEEQAKADLRNTIRTSLTMANSHATNLATESSRASTAPASGFDAAAAKQVIYMNMGIPVTRADLSKAFTIGREQLQKIPVYKTIEREVGESVEQLIRNMNPEALGPQARQAATVVAENMAEQMRQDSIHTTQSSARREYWNARGGEQWDFIKKFEKGEAHTDPIMQKAAEGYRQWNKDINESDTAIGLKYDARDNYLYHLFEDQNGLESFLNKKFGNKWNDPKFIKEREFNLYSQAVAAGFRPKFFNPEDIMLARQHASDVTRMRTQTLRDFDEFGLARKVEKGGEPLPGEVEWRAPNGERYWVNPEAGQILHNAFNTQSLWNLKGIGGAAFRGSMVLKNTLVPIKLMASLFHPIHVQTIDNVTSVVRATKELTAGAISPQEFIKQAGQGLLYKGIIDNPKTGNRLINAWKGKIPESALSDSDRLAMQYMTEGGFVPEMSTVYKNNSIQKFKDAKAQNSVSALWHLPFAMVEAIQHPVFEVWIPALKANSYIKDVQSALKVDPSLMNDSLKRMETFRKLAKSVDNRYGEMQYNTLFWNKWIKDIGVGSTLSLGWNLGFIREYGGAVSDVAKMAKEGSQALKVDKGLADRAVFVTAYTMQSLAYGGLMTYLLSGSLPQTLMDYVYPKTGDKNADGSDARVNTMFYSREFGAAYQHMKNEGVGAGALHMALNKASPVIDDLRTWATNIDYFGNEISDPNAPEYKQLQQKLAWEFSNLAPISVSAPQKAGQTSAKSYALSIAGFSPTPKYLTASETENKISHVFKTYHPRVTPYEKAEYGDDSGKLRQAYLTGDSDTYRDQLQTMREKYNLSYDQMSALRRNVKLPGSVKMFKALTENQQIKLLKEMPEEDKQTYLHYAHKRARREAVTE